MSGPENELVNRDNDDLKDSVELLLLLSRTEFSGELQHQINAVFESFSSW